jgi:hypothetical protein
MKKMSLIAQKIGQAFKNSIKKINYLFSMVQVLHFLMKPCNPASLRRRSHSSRTITDKC